MQQWWECIKHIAPTSMIAFVLHMKIHEKKCIFYSNEVNCGKQQWLWERKEEKEREEMKLKEMGR